MFGDVFLHAWCGICFGISGVQEFWECKEFGSEKTHRFHFVENLGGAGAKGFIKLGNFFAKPETDGALQMLDHGTLI
jgi:hypothetical protein